MSVTPSWTTEYQVGTRQSLPYWADPGESGNHLHMVEALTEIAETEGPVHMELVHERVRDWWGVGRVGANIRANIDLAIRSAKILRDGDFIDVPNRSVHQVRVPSARVTRKVEQVHVEELSLAAALLRRDVGAATRAEVVQQVAWIFGWTRTGPNVDRIVNEAIDRLVATNEIAEAAYGHLTSQA